MSAIAGRRRWLAAAVLSALATTGAASEVIWRLGELAQVGGYRTTIEGAPRVVAGPNGSAIEFDGRRDGLFIASPTLRGATAFTVEILFRPDEGGLREQRFFHLQDKAGARAMIETRLDGRGHWWLDTFLTSGAPRAGVALIDPARQHPTGRWTWAALRFDGQRVAHFVNGTKEVEQPAKFAGFGECLLSLGVRQNKVHWFKGAIAEVRFHDVALPDDRLQRVADGPR